LWTYEEPHPGYIEGKKEQYQSEPRIFTGDLAAREEQNKEGSADYDDFKKYEGAKPPGFPEGVDERLEEPFKVDPFGPFEGVGERVCVRDGLVLPNPFPGLQMPPDVKAADLLGGKADYEAYKN